MLAHTHKCNLLRELCHRDDRAAGSDLECIEPSGHILHNRKKSIEHSISHSIEHFIERSIKYFIEHAVERSVEHSIEHSIEHSNNACRAVEPNKRALYTQASTNMSTHMSACTHICVHVCAQPYTSGSCMHETHGMCIDATPMDHTCSSQAVYMRHAMEHACNA